MSGELLHVGETINDGNREKVLGSLALDNSNVDDDYESGETHDEYEGYDDDEMYDLNDDWREYDEIEDDPSCEIYGYDHQDEGETCRRRVEYDHTVNGFVSSYPIPQELIERYDFLRGLPDGIAVMGGAARSVAREMLTGDREPIRDIDLVNILDSTTGKSKVSSNMLDKLSEKWMPDDYAFGHGIGDDTFDHYFKTRDFTINQVLIMGDKLYIPEMAEADFMENIIRPTYYEKPFYDSKVGSRLTMKAIMLQAVLEQVTSSYPLIEDIDEMSDFSISRRTEYAWSENMDTFDTALYLNKAMGRDIETAMRFTEILADYNVVGYGYAGRPKLLATDLKTDLFNFSFRPSGHYDTPELRDMDGLLQVTPSIPTHDAETMEGLALYNSQDFTSDEAVYYNRARKRGKYSQKDFDDINRGALLDYINQ